MNAFTGKEYTCFYARVLDDDLPLAVDVVCDMVTSALIRPADVDAERGVILEEIAMRDDDPSDLVHEEFAEADVRRQPAGPADPRHRRDDRALSPRGRSTATTASATGPRTWSSRPPATSTTPTVVRLVRKAFGAGRPARGRRRCRRRRAPGAPARIGGRGRPRCVASAPSRPTWCSACPALDRADERRFALGVLNAALGGGMSSRLFQEIREKRGLAYSVYSFASQYADTGMFGVYAGCLPEQGRRGAGDLPRAARAVVAPAASPTRSSSAARASCAAGWCSAWRTPARG